MYPKAIPASGLPKVVEMTRQMTRDLDLPVFEFMDYSEGATVEGNTDLTAEVVDAYSKGMPEAIGFINGYAPSYTFAVRRETAHLVRLLPLGDSSRSRRRR